MIQDCAQVGGNLQSAVLNRANVYDNDEDDNDDDDKDYDNGDDNSDHDKRLLCSKTRALQILEQGAEGKQLLTAFSLPLEAASQQHRQNLCKESRIENRIIESAQRTSIHPYHAAALLDLNEAGRA